MISSRISTAYVFLQQGKDMIPVGIVCQREEQYQFAYAKSWLARPNAFPLDPLNLPLQAQTFCNMQMFDVLLDAVSDNWGMRVMAAKYGQLPQSPIECLLAAQGRGVGALVFAAMRDQLPSKLPTPQFEQLELIADAASELDARRLIEDPIALDLLWYGGGMGGAKPKTTIMHDNQEWIAKFGSNSDQFDEVRAEFACLAMARDAGIDVPENKLIELPRHSVLLVKRFDRENGNRCVHYISAHALLGTNQMPANYFIHRHSYVDIVQVIRKVSNHAKADCQQLFRRMLFNMAICNTDDHLKNHGFLFRAKEGFRLSPAFDLLPHPTQPSLHSLDLGFESNAGGLENAISVADQFLLRENQAREILNKVLVVTSNAEAYFRYARMCYSNISMAQNLLR